MNVFDAAAAVRQLLLDQLPLAHAANRQPRLKLRFVVNNLPRWEELRESQRANVAYYGPALAPARGPIGKATRTVTLERFLALPVVQTTHHKLTVRQVIKFAANKAGGVHFDEGPDETRTLLEALMRAINTERTPVLANTLHAIAVIVVEALKPLREYIES